MVAPYVVDLHAHFPMQFDPAGAHTFRKAMRHHRKKDEKLRDRVLFLALEIADRLFNRESPDAPHAVTIDTLTEGNVGVAFSVAYCPFEELDLDDPPHDAYFGDIHDLLKIVERVVKDDGRARVVRDFSELQAARSEGKVAMIHAIEGGFHLGGGDEAIARNVEKLAAMGLGYVTVAHLFYRQVATNVPALPFLSDNFYRLVFKQPEFVGLTPRGRVLVQAMAKHGVLVDVTHMSERGMADTFDLLDDLDPAKRMPVIASHIACAHPGGYAYNLGEKWVKKIAERGGVCGVIYCDHYVRDSAGSRTKTFAESFALVKDQIAKLRAWGGDDVLAIGSDLDGFIKPTLAGLSSAANHKDLAAALHDEYGAALAEKICHTNAMRVLETGWRKGV